MNVTKIILILLTFSVLSPLWSQKNYQQKTKKSQYYGNQRLYKPLFRWVTGDHHRHGLHFAIGPTYTFTKLSPVTGEIQLNQDSLFRYSHEAKGRLGVYVEAGMVHITKRPRKFIQYYDWALAYKHLGGAELFEARLYDNRDTLVANLSGRSGFYNGYLSGRFTIHNVFQLDPYTFLDNGIGINGDYGLIGLNKAYYNDYLPQTQKFQGNLIGQVHYTFGFGFKPMEGFFIVPSIEVPIVTAYEWNGINPSLHWFSSRYYPALLKVKFVWLFKKDPNRCPPVDLNEDDLERNKEFLNR